MQELITLGVWDVSKGEWYGTPNGCVDSTNFQCQDFLIGHVSISANTTAAANSYLF